LPTWLARERLAGGLRLKGRSRADKVLSGPSVHQIGQHVRTDSIIVAPSTPQGHLATPRSRLISAPPQRI
jgi:hypothetical protein